MEAIDWRKTLLLSEILQPHGQTRRTNNERQQNGWPFASRVLRNSVVKRSVLKWSLEDGFECYFWSKQASLLSLKAMVSCISCNHDLSPKFRLSNAAYTRVFTDFVQQHGLIELLQRSDSYISNTNNLNPLKTYISPLQTIGLAHHWCFQMFPKCAIIFQVIHNTSLLI